MDEGNGAGDGVARNLSAAVAAAAHSAPRSPAQQEDDIFNGGMAMADGGMAMAAAVGGYVDMDDVAWRSSPGDTPSPVFRMFRSPSNRRGERAAVPAPSALP